MQAKLAGFGMISSMSRKDNCWDSAPTQSFFDNPKNEWAHGARYATRTQATVDVFERIRVICNRRRRHSTLADSVSAGLDQKALPAKPGGMRAARSKAKKQGAPDAMAESFFASLECESLDRRSL
ncbi:MAG: hypothetical protein ISP90_15950 [Nevskia sp.]|nr:hypothetical protein [Nevskia sp.]